MITDLAHKRVSKTLLTEISTEYLKVKSEFEINTLSREAMFWAQMAHETGGFRWLREIGGRRYFSKYDGRKDLGNTEPGDGFRFRGRGLIHITGRHNYIKYGKKLGIDLVGNPGMAAYPKVAVLIALHFWKDHNLNVHADAGNVRKVTRRINGGYNGLEDRIKYYKKAMKLGRMGCK